jgi:hypothetical protein
MMKDSLKEAYRIKRIYRRLAKIRGEGASMPADGDCTARERGQAAGIPWVSSGGVTEDPQYRGYRG